MRPIDLLRICCLMALLFQACKEEERPPEPLPAVIYKQYDKAIVQDGSPFLLDVDSNGRIDYTLTVTIDEQQGYDKAIFRLKGEIFGIYTSSIYAPLWELSESEQCNVFYSSVLAAANFEPGDSISNALGDNWRFTGDFHHGQSCLSPSCPCPVPSSDITYVPIEKGSIGYVGLRFIIRNRKHYAWIELEHSATTGQEYVIRRIAYNRFPEQSIPIPQ